MTEATPIETTTLLDQLTRDVSKRGIPIDQLGRICYVMSDHADGELHFWYDNMSHAKVDEVPRIEFMFGNDMIDKAVKGLLGSTRVKIHDMEHFMTAVQKAKDIKDISLARCLERVLSWVTPTEDNNFMQAQLDIFPDFVQHSFFFSEKVMRDGKMQPSIYGGIILHGLEDTLLVEMEPGRAKYWSVHT